MGKSGLYCIQDTRSDVGNSVVWWRVAAAGYTVNVDEAWIVGRAQAMAIERNSKTAKAWPVESVERAITRQVDAQRLR